MQLFDIHNYLLKYFIVKYRKIYFNLLKDIIFLLNTISKINIKLLNLLSNFVVNLLNRLSIPVCNISCGYYNAHKNNEYTQFSELQNCLSFVNEIISNSPFP
jgi:hypothetical protein